MQVRQQPIDDLRQEHLGQQIDDLTLVKSLQQILNQSRPPQQLLVIVVEMAGTRVHTPHLEEIEVIVYELGQLLRSNPNLKFYVTKNQCIGNCSQLADLEEFEKVEVFLCDLREFMLGQIVGCCIGRFLISAENLTHYCNLKGTAYTAIYRIRFLKSFIDLLQLPFIIFFEIAQPRCPIFGNFSSE